MYMYIYIYIYTEKHTHTHRNIYTLCAQVHELPQSHCGDDRESTLLSCLHIYVYIYVYI